MSTPAASASTTPADTPLTTPGASPVLGPSTPLPVVPDDIKMIISDVDGTLFTDKHELHPRTRDAIRHIRKTRPEMPIIPVTGKQRVSCGTLIEELGIQEFPMGCLHGSIIYDKDGNIEHATYLEPNFVRDVTELMKQHNKTTMLYVHDWVAMASKEEGGKTDWEAVSRGFDPCVKDERESDFLQQVLDGKQQIGKIFLPMDEELVPHFLDLLHSSFPNVPFKTTRALPYIIEIVAEGVDKSVALQYFCKKYGISPSNVATFGDGDNDVGMFSASGHPVSMANAMEAPRLASKYQTLSNNDGGVGLWLHAAGLCPPYDASKSLEVAKSLDAAAAIAESKLSA